MPTDLTVILQNHPGTMADMGEAAGKAGVDLKAGGGFECGGEGVMHVLVDDADVEKAKEAFESAGLEVRGTREVVMTTVEDSPGGLGKVARKLADAGVNIDLIYGSADGLVLGVDDPDAARRALGA